MRSAAVLAFLVTTAAQGQLIGEARVSGSCDLTLSPTQGTVSSFSQVQFYNSFGNAASCEMQGDHRIDTGTTSVDRLQWGVQNGYYSGTRTGTWQYSKCYDSRNHGAAYPGGLENPAVNGGPWNGNQQCAPDPPPPPPTGCGSNGLPCEQSESCPLILDLNGDGIRTTGLDDPVHFWIDLNGRTETTAWTNPATEEAFLWTDLNHDHLAQVTELFGSRMRASHGDYHANGFEALDTYDRPELGGNGDGRITQSDSIWARLKLWVDRNHDGISQPTEISVLSSHRIVALNLHHSDGDTYDEYGNEIYLIGSYVVRSHGNETEERLMADIEFKYIPNL